MENKKYILSAFADEASGDIDSQIKALIRNEISQIEIRNIDSENIIFKNEYELKEIKKKLDYNGISVSAIASPIGKIKITNDFTAHFEDFKKAVFTAEILETENIRIFSFFINADEHEKYKYEVLNRLNSFIEYSSKSNIFCCHENESNIYGDTANRCIELINAFDGKLKCIFDPANFVQCSENAYESFKKLKENIFYFHIKDVLKTTKEAVLAGFGDGNIEEILKCYNKNAILTLEPHLMIFDGYANLADEESISTKNKYKSNDEAFDVAASAIKSILERI